MNKRERLVRLLKNEPPAPKKKLVGDKLYVQLPTPTKKDMTDYAYGLDIDEKVVKMAAKLAERMAISMAREMMNMNMGPVVERIIADVSQKVIDAIPEQQTVIQQVVQESTSEFKKAAGALVFDNADMNIDRAQGLELSGEIGTKSKSKDSTDDALEALDLLF